MIQDPMSPGLDGLRAINTDGSIVYGVSLAEIVHCSKYKNFGDEGLSALAAGPEIGLHPMSLDLDSRFSHSGLQSSAGLGGKSAFLLLLSRLRLTEMELRSLRQPMLRRTTLIYRLVAFGMTLCWLLWMHQHDLPLV